MKKAILLITLLCSFASLNAQNSSSLSKENAWQLVKKQVLKDSTEGKIIYMSDEPLSAGSSIPSFLRTEHSPLYKAWFFFIDDMPEANWDHPCRWVFVNVGNGAYEIRDRRNPPDLKNMSCIVRYEKEALPSQSNYAQKKLSKTSNLRKATSSSNLGSHNYAVIISGGMNMENNHFRYWNDCSSIYSTLVNSYFYPKDHIYVLMSDGTNPSNDRNLGNGVYDSSPLDLDGDGSDDIGFSATTSNISLVFDTLSALLSSSDTLFIYTMDHGGSYEGSSYLYLWGSSISDYSFANEVDKVNAGKIIVCMGQCYSGGFIDDLQGTNRVICTASRDDESSYALENLQYDAYVYHWTAAITGHDAIGTQVDADINNDGMVSIEEAHSYASNQDTRPEHPQYSSTPSSLGGNLNMGSCYIDGKIYGPSNLYNNSSMFDIGLTSPLFNTQWSLTGDDATNFYVYNDTPGLNQCTIVRKNNAVFSESNSLTLSANIMYDNTLVKTINKIVSVPYISGNVIPCGYSIYNVMPRPEGYTVSWSFQGTGLIPEGDLINSFELEDPLAYLINNTNHGALVGTLKAAVKQGNNALYELSKKIDSYADFSGSWYQVPLPFDTINSTPTNIQGHAWINAVPNRMIVLNSNDFIGTTLSYTSDRFNLINMTNSNGTLSFIPVPKSTSLIGTITITGRESACNKILITINLSPSPQSFYPGILSSDPSLNCSKDGGIYKFSVITDTENIVSDNSHKWKAVVIHASSGRKIYSLTSDDNNFFIDTTSWQAGIYTITVYNNEYILKKKFIVLQ